MILKRDLSTAGECAATACASVVREEERGTSECTSAHMQICNCFPCDGFLREIGMTLEVSSMEGSPFWSSQFLRLCGDG